MKISWYIIIAGCYNPGYIYIYGDHELDVRFFSIGSRATIKDGPFSVQYQHEGYITLQAQVCNTTRLGTRKD